VVFKEAVRDVVSDQGVSAFYSCESPTRANGYGYELEALESGGVLATHVKAPGVRRWIPESNIRYADLAEGPKRGRPAKAAGAEAA
jgi:hypothetical protein